MAACQTGLALISVSNDQTRATGASTTILALACTGAESSVCPRLARSWSEASEQPARVRSRQRKAQAIRALVVP